MRLSITKLKGLGFILWHTRHHAVHISFGLLWVWFLREMWGYLSDRWITIAIFGSLFPDIDHIMYIFFYGKKDLYSQQIKSFLRSHQWRTAAVFISKGHKHNTNLVSHNYYIMAVMFALCIASSIIDWQSGIVLFGSMVIHYVVDVVDDLIVLGRVNSNWKRWGRPKKIDLFSSKHVHQES